MCQSWSAKWPKPEVGCLKPEVGCLKPEGGCPPHRYHDTADLALTLPLTLTRYHDAADLVDGELKAPEGREAEAVALRLSCQLNEAQMCLKQAEWASAATVCTSVLEREPENVKARPSPPPYCTHSSTLLTLLSLLTLLTLLSTHSTHSTHSALSTHSSHSTLSTHSTRSSCSFFFSLYSLCSLYVKALFRRGSALAKSADYAAARADLLAASKLDPKSKEIREAFTACKEAEAAAKAKDKAFAAKMFG